MIPPSNAKVGIIVVVRKKGAGRPKEGRTKVVKTSKHRARSFYSMVESVERGQGLSRCSITPGHLRRARANREGRNVPHGGVTVSSLSPTVIWARTSALLRRRYCIGARQLCEAGQF